MKDLAATNCFLTSSHHPTSVTTSISAFKMRLKEEQNEELRLWASGKLENITETDSAILADYAVALLKSDAPIEDVRKNVTSELQGILDESKSISLCLR